MTTLPLGEWNGKQLDINLEKDGRRVEVEIPDPDGGDELAIMTIDLPYLKSRRRGVIEMFSVTARDTGKNTFKGLGKAMLCAVFQYIKDIGRISDSDVISLEATGGIIKDALLPNSEESDETLEETIRNYGDSVLENTKKRYRTYWKKNGYSYRQVLINTVRNINQTRVLIEYYKQYGFEVIPEGDKGERAEMASTVGKILSACSAPKKESSVNPELSADTTKSAESPVKEDVSSPNVEALKGGKKTRRTKRKQKFSRRK